MRDLDKLEKPIGDVESPARLLSWPLRCVFGGRGAKGNMGAVCRKEEEDDGV